MHPQLLPILAALTSGTVFALMQLIMKRHTTRETHPLFMPAYFGLLAPVWLLGGLTSGALGALEFNLSFDGLKYPFLWATVTVVSTCTLVWLFKTFSLTELTGYRKALITLGALLMDVLVFHLVFPAPELLAIALLLTGALLLSRSRSRLPNLAEFGILIAWCSIMTAQITFYKEGQLHQTSVLANTVLMQFTSSCLYACFWLLPSLRKSVQHIPLSHLAVLLGTNLIGTLLEGFAYSGLPLAVLIVLTILPSTLFAAHDLWHGHLPRHPRSYTALAILAAGLVLLMLTK
jgi:hypothetical protein